MKVGSDELFTNFSMDEMAFNPSIKPPAKTKGKAKQFTPSTMSTNLEVIKCDESLDFFKHLSSCNSEAEVLTTADREP